MLLNCSNHPSAGWGEALLEAAKQYGEVKDLPFPQIEPAMTTQELRRLTDEYAKRIEALHPDAVMAAGEFTFLFMLVKEEYRKKGTLPEKLTVTTRYVYSENDVLSMKNYRISC